MTALPEIRFWSTSPTMRPGDAAVPVAAGFAATITPSTRSNHCEDERRRDGTAPLTTVSAPMTPFRRGR